MGSPKSEIGPAGTEHQVPVTLTHGYWLGRYEVTQLEWQTLMHTTPWQGKENVKEGDNYPVTFVSWDEANKFCEKLTETERRAGRLPAGWKYMLPTEAQWEYACRAGTTTRYSFGDKVRISVTTRGSWRTPPMVAGQEILTTSGKRKRILGGSVTCTGMSGNGAGIAL